MNNWLSHTLLFVFMLIQLGCKSQSNNPPACSSQHQREINTTIKSIDTSAGWSQVGQKLLVTGIVYQQDGKTPVPNVVLYYYHTNTEGRYLHKPELKISMPPNELGQTHGYIRGWVKTDSVGKYSILTVRPGAYPNSNEPAHIHFTVKEPDFKEYYIDDVVFDDDKFLTTKRRLKAENRAGSGVVRLVYKDNLGIAERNIILGLNIPDHPRSSPATIQSGRNIGEDVVSFTPYHAWGPDKGTKTCPVCKYGRYHGILYFVGNHPNWQEIKSWLVFLEAESKKRQKFLKAYFIYGNDQHYDFELRNRELFVLGKELKLRFVALTFVPSFLDQDSDIHYNKLNPSVDNSIIIYKQSRIVDKFINLKPSDANFNIIVTRLDETINEYFRLGSEK